MTNLTDAAVQRMLRDAQTTPTPQVGPIEHHIGGQINVGDMVMPDGSQVKVLSIAHPSGHAWITKLPLAAAQTIAKELQKPPRIPNGAL